MNRRKALAEQMIWNDEIQRNEAYKIRIKEGVAHNTGASRFGILASWLIIIIACRKQVTK